MVEAELSKNYSVLPLVFIQSLPLNPKPFLSGLTGKPVMVIVLTCGFILNKGLVFSVLFVFLCKAGPKVSVTGQEWGG